MNTDNLVLRPNCLLTKYPLVFVSGPRSLFHYSRYAGDLQDYLAAHGYRVFAPVMPFRSRALREIVLKNRLESLSEKNFHFFLSPATRAEFSPLFQNYTDSTFTNTADFAQDSVSAPLQYGLHKFFCFLKQTKAEPYKDTVPFTSPQFFDRILDHCIELAENE